MCVCVCVGIDVIGVCLFIDYTKKDNFSFVVCHSSIHQPKNVAMWWAIQQLI